MFATMRKDFGFVDFVMKKILAKNQLMSNILLI